MSGLTYPEAIVVGAFQGVSELFPVSSLGHSVLVPALVGGRWAADLNVSAPESPYLAYIVGLHVATAMALLLFFWRDWVAIVTGFFTSIRDRSVEEPYQRLAWLIVLATIPVGISGLLLEHTFRTTLGKPIPAAVFLTLNGLVLAAGEGLRRLAAPAAPAAATGVDPQSEGAAHRPPGDPVLALTGHPVAHEGLQADIRLSGMPLARALLIGSAQTLALLPGISRSGITMVAGLGRGLSHEDSARFSFLLATPVIFAAGVLKLPDLFGPLGQGIRGPVVAGSVASFVSAYLAVRFLTRYFSHGTLWPFARYCLVAGSASLAWLVLFG